MLGQSRHQPGPAAGCLQVMVESGVSCHHVLCTYDWLFQTHMEVRSYSIAVSDLFRLAKCPQRPSVVLQTTRFSSFSRLHNSPLYVQTMSSPSTHPLRGSWVASMSLILQWRWGADSSSHFPAQSLSTHTQGWDAGSEGSSA